MSTLSPNFKRPVKSSPRILVLDDDADIREFYVEALVLGGYQVDAAADGQAGWEALQTREYDLLITDYEMPGMSGLDLVKKLSSSGMTLAVIIASGALSREELKEQLPTQVAVALAKPISPSELLTAVQHVLCGRDHSGAHAVA